MTSKSKILLIVDDLDLSRSISQELSKHHYSVLLSTDNVMQKIFDEVPHLVILDESFNQGEGKSLTRHLKQDLVLKHIPILLLVNSSDAYLAERFAQADIYFEKAKGVHQLAARVQEVLNRNYNELDLNPLTGLPGSRSSVLRIERAIHSKQLFGVCCIDLSNLASYNSAYGDARGDQVLVKLGKIIQAVVKKKGSSENFIGHFGGDDFIVVTQSSEQAIQISEEIINAFDSSAPNFYDAHDRELGYIVQRDPEGVLTRYPIMNVSVVIFDNHHMLLSGIGEIGKITNELKKYIKTLTGSCYVNYHVRSRGNANESEDTALEFHFPSKKESVKLPGQHLSLHRDPLFFSALMKSKKVRTCYQPIVELKSKKIIGYEALTRSLQSGLFSDATLLFDLARKANRIKELDQICVDQALKSAQSLKSDEKLFLNLNPETLLDPAVMKNLFSFKGVIGFKNLVIEVTEQSILRSFVKMREALEELRGQGVSVAIDDVGGGAVSLRDVSLLKPDYIKFDRSLIRQMDASTTKQQIVLSMILFANGIGATTAAEGIETKKEYETLLMCGIHLGQGYFFAKPGIAFPEVK